MDVRGSWTIYTGPDLSENTLVIYSLVVNLLYAYSRVCRGYILDNIHTTTRTLLVISYTAGSPLQYATTGGVVLLCICIK